MPKTEGITDVGQGKDKGSSEQLFECMMSPGAWALDVLHLSVTSRYGLCD